MIQRCGPQMRSDSAAGFDLPSILSAAQVLGYDAQAALLLTQYADIGLREAIKKHVSQSDSHSPDRSH